MSPKTLGAGQLTARQERLLAAIRDHWRAHDRSPTHFELAETLDASRESITQMIPRLVMAGVIRVTNDHTRNIELITPPAVEATGKRRGRSRKT